MENKMFLSYETRMMQSTRNAIELMERSAHKLHVMIENWEYLSSVERGAVYIDKTNQTINCISGDYYKIRPLLGICANVYSDLYHYKFHKEWVEQHGDISLIDDSCWIAGDNEYYAKDVNLFKNPKRLHFCIWLRHRLLDELAVLRKKLGELQ